MIIYKITNLINNKVYIGQTTQPLKKRWADHCKPSSTNCAVLHRSILKYGRDNFSIEIIDTAVTLEELNRKEAYWISYYNSITPNGYNLQSGGDRFKFSDETKLKIKNNRPSAKPVNQYLISGEYVKTWQSANDAGKTLNIPTSNIQGCCHNKRGCRSAGGFIWSYEKTEKLEYKSKLHRKIKCVETGKVFNSITDAANTIGKTPACIVNHLKGLRQSAGGFHWEYYEQETG